MSAAVELAVELWQVPALGACLVAAGAGGAAVAAWLLLTLAGPAPAGRAAGSCESFIEAFTAELRARAQLRLRAVGAALASVVTLAVIAAVIATITGLMT